MRLRSIRRMIMLSLVASAFLAWLSSPSQAQAPPTPSPGQYYETSTGGGTDYSPANAGQSVQVVEGKPEMKAVSPTASEFSTALEFESWKAEGNRVASGHRSTLLLGYTLGLSRNTEVAFTAPLQQVKVDGTAFNNSGLSDVEVAYRKYFQKPEDPAAPTIVCSARVFLPTGDFNRILGIGEWSYGGSVTASKPFGAQARTLGYAGAGYTFTGDPAGVNLNNVFYCWAGGVTQLKNPRWSVQYELLRFKSPQDENYTRALLGARFSLTPTRGIQINLKRELQADGRSTTLAVGYSSRM